MGRGQGTVSDILYGNTEPRSSSPGWTPPGPILRDHPYINYSIEYDYINWKPIVEQHMGGNVTRQTEVFHAPHPDGKVIIQLKGKMLGGLDEASPAVKKLQELLAKGKETGVPVLLELPVADSDARPGVAPDQDLEKYELLLGHDQVQLDLAEYNDGQELLLGVQARQCKLKPLEAAGQYKYYRPIKNLPVPLKTGEEVILLPLPNHLPGQGPNTGSAQVTNPRNVRIKLNRKLLDMLEAKADQAKADGDADADEQSSFVWDLDKRLRRGLWYADGLLVAPHEPREIIQADGQAVIACLPSSPVKVSFMDSPPGSVSVPAGALELPRSITWISETGRRPTC